MPETLKLVCHACGQANRVPRDRLAAAPKCGVCGAPLAAGKVAELDPATLAKAIQDDLPLVVDFWAPWCGPCRQMAPEFIKAAAALAPAVRFAKIDTQAHSEVAARHRIQGIPAFILFHKGREVARAAGARPAADLVAFVKSKLAA
ncbi:thioredoxin TrxC [Phaeovulum sp.]|uniref:thioredoxin TrxC n=1 Tax=Phaeovulum sp. TaxID=2934796 RepID=UPI0027315CD0|nr:thioredoxin TrxC [Phaeovulum sp.]MDP1668626.1 thioredoxin TrxC [Phaeovulum sp.]MDP3862073.1 thioredoxin TrxC [Phaeovulum sp.]MDZ4119885.1 thioredoxin TrxC [Phaeovulum sp.]